MVSLEEFHQNLVQTILSDTQSRGLTKSKSFFENVCEELVEIAELTRNYTEAEYIKRGMEVYGYDYDDERGNLNSHHASIFPRRIYTNAQFGRN